jgi:hypothetical protein
MVCDCYLRVTPLSEMCPPRSGSRFVFSFRSAEPEVGSRVKPNHCGCGVAQGCERQRGFASPLLLRPTFVRASSLPSLKSLFLNESGLCGLVRLGLKIFAVRGPFRSRMAHESIECTHPCILRRQRRRPRCGRQEFNPTSQLFAGAACIRKLTPGRTLYSHERDGLAFRLHA